MDKIISLVKPHLPVDTLRALLILLDEMDTESKRDILAAMLEDEQPATGVPDLEEEENV